MKKDSEQLTVRFLAHVGKDRDNPFVMVIDGEEHVIEPGHVNGIFFDEGDEMLLRYVDDTRIEFETIKDGAASEE